MPPIELQLWLLRHQLTPHHPVAILRAASFPERSLVTDSARGQHELQTRIAKFAEGSDPGRLYLRQLPEAVEAGRVAVTCEPSARDLFWRTPFSVAFDYLQWNHLPHGRIALVPALGIEVVVQSPQAALDAELQKQIHLALMRLGEATELSALARYDLLGEMQVARCRVPLEIRTPKQIAMAEERGRAQTSLLEEIGTRLGTRQRRRGPRAQPAFAVDAELGRLAEPLLAESPRSVLLVGPSGVGKTALVREFARREAERIAVWSTNGSRIVAGQSGFGQWQQRCRDLVQEVAKQPLVLHLENLMETIEVGKGGGSQLGVAGFLRTFISRGQLLVVSECTPQQLALFERSEPQLLQAFERVEVKEPGPDKMRAILAGVAQHAKPLRSQVPPEALETIERLHRRFATYSAQPGRPVRFLRNLLEDLPRGRSLTARDVYRRFQRETGLPHFMLDQSRRFLADEARREFGEQVKGQPAAIEAVVAAVSTAKAGLNRPQRPIASFLFLGPTGVGKTEMAKALTRFMFGDADRMVRIDMSEYADWSSVSRLTGGPQGSGLLTSAIRQQPFAVLLLDEFEKAHPNCYDLLLQVLGEGRLTDHLGNVADFTNAIIILTSNLGAELFQQQALGFDDSPRSWDALLTSRVQEFLRPEMYNRIDQLVVFQPLLPDQVQQIAHRELDAIGARSGIRYRDVQWRIAPEVAAWVAERGYSRTYGARQLKRTLERELVVPLAERLNRYHRAQPVQADVTVVDGRLDVQVKARKSVTGSEGAELAYQRRQKELLESLGSLRRAVQGFDQCSYLVKLRNAIYRLQRLITQWTKQGGARAQRERYQQELRDNEALEAQVAELREEVYAAETRFLTGYHQRQTLDLDNLERETRRLSTALRELQLHFLTFDNRGANRVTLAVYSMQFERLLALSRAYDRMGREAGFQVKRAALRRSAFPQTPEGVTTRLLHPPVSGEGAEDESARRARILFDVYPLRQDGDLDVSRQDAAGIALTFSGRAAFVMLGSEAGLHIFRGEAGRNEYTIVETCGGSLHRYEPSAHLKPPLKPLELELAARRTYDLGQGVIYDNLLDQKFEFREPLATALTTGVSRAVELAFDAKLREMIDPWS